jgi:hypothetical protein
MSTASDVVRALSVVGVRPYDLFLISSAAVGSCSCPYCLREVVINYYIIYEYLTMSKLILIFSRVKTKTKRDKTQF